MVTSLDKYEKKIGRNATYYCSVCLVPLCTSLFRGVEGQGALQTCFQRFHTCVNLVRQSKRSHKWLISSRKFDNRKSNRPRKEGAIDNKENLQPASNKVEKNAQGKQFDDETTLDKQSNYKSNLLKRKSSTRQLFYATSNHPTFTILQI